MASFWAIQEPEPKQIPLVTGVGRELFRSVVERFQDDFIVLFDVKILRWLAAKQLTPEHALRMRYGDAGFRVQITQCCLREFETFVGTAFVRYPGVGNAIADIFLDVPLDCPHNDVQVDSYDCLREVLGLPGAPNYVLASLNRDFYREIQRELGTPVITVHHGRLIISLSAEEPVIEAAEPFDPRDEGEEEGEEPFVAAELFDAQVVREDLVERKRKKLKKKRGVLFFKTFWRLAGSSKGKKRNRMIEGQ